MTYALIYSLPGRNYAVDPATISDADQLKMAKLAASGTMADLEDFVSILSRYPATAYQVLPPTPLKPEGPFGALNPDILDALGIDIAGLIQMAMLICMEVEREMRQMGLELSQSQVEQMVAKALEEKLNGEQTNKAQFNAALAGAIASIVTGAAGGAAGIASFVKMGQGEKLTASARRDQDKLKQDAADLAKRRGDSDKTFDNTSKEIETRKTNLEHLESENKQTKEEITELRDKILSDKNDQTKCAADDAVKTRLQRKEEELDAAKQEEKETAKALKELDDSDGATAPDGVDVDFYRSHLQNQHALQKDEVDDLQVERDTMLGTAARDNPAAAAPFLQRDRDAARADLASKEREKTALEETLADVSASKERLIEQRDELNLRGSNGEKVRQSEYDRLDTEASTLDARETKARRELVAKNAEIASLKVKQAGIEGKLDGLIPPAAKAERQELLDDVDLRTAKVESLKDKKADLEREIESNRLEIIATERQIADGLPGPHLAAATAKLTSLKQQKKELDEALPETELNLKQENAALQAKRIELDSNDLQKLEAAETRLKEQDSEIEAGRYEVNKQEAELTATQQKENAAFDAEDKRIEDGMRAAEDKLNAARSKTEEAAAWRTGLDAIGKVLAGFTNLGQSVLTLQADDLRTLGQYLARQFEILQVGQGIYSSFADNMKSSIDETRQTFFGMLNEAAKANQAIAQRC
ncbi:ATPase involved in DNA repair [Variovorax sp. PBL-H6]|uniref:hypothetical protein n=1 Tax=Variovorax sp. PBL-H6 TaxID=434009 RepID=UPI001317C655|nr:hypothetical protein [Variovorax sp. PBL-H6]VTU22742.1 ATPase involved in DNA repair [Variovorax sp. PBL-H6]